MGLVIGMDEAGYGPNLGPLVVTVTVWDVPGQPRDTDFWKALEDVVSQTAVRGDARLQVADSKQVYTPARGLAALERSVLSGLNLAGQYPGSLRELWQSLWTGEPAKTDVEPWFADADVRLPVERHSAGLAEITERLAACCRSRSIRLRTIKSDVVLTERFNRLTREFDSKGVTLSRVSLQLLRAVWDPDDPQPVLIIADKHGGRNRYDELLADVLDGQMIFRGKESTALSSYRIGETEIRFQTKAESHLPVALASMVSKYVRELSMILFNRFWCERLPGLKPTKGYPLDAARFKADISELQSQLGIPDDVLWRER